MIAFPPIQSDRIPVRPAQLLPPMNEQDMLAQLRARADSEGIRGLEIVIDTGYIRPFRATAYGLSCFGPSITVAVADLRKQIEHAAKGTP